MTPSTLPMTRVTRSIKPSGSSRAFGRRSDEVQLGINDVLKGREDGPGPETKKGIPEGIWSKCAACNQIIYQKDFLKNHKVCPMCSFHYQLTARERVASLIDPGTFEELNAELRSADPLDFTGNKTYRESIEQSMKNTNLPEAVVTGRGLLNGRPVFLAVMDFHFIGGTMGSVVGEKIARAVEEALAADSPFISVAASGGARMQEGVFSLMQMAKTSATLARLAERRLPHISVLTHPTLGGVTASFATLADVIIAEPGAQIGFTGPRVIEQTIRQKLPDGFQTAEFLLEHGMVDIVLARSKIKGAIATFLDLALGQPRRSDFPLTAIIPEMPASAEELTKQVQRSVKRGTKQVQKTVKNGTKRLKKGVKKISDTVRGE